MKIQLNEYHEPKERRVIFIIWRIIRCAIFMFAPNSVRIWMLRMFGAHIGAQCLIYGSSKIYAPWNLTVGDLVCIGPRVEIYNKAKVSIGCGVVISQDAWLCTASHDIADPRMALVKRPIRIEDDVWVAARAVVLPGVTIGTGCVVGACAVVAKNVAGSSIVVGNPARLVGQRVLNHTETN